MLALRIVMFIYVFISLRPTIFKVGDCLYFSKYFGVSAALVWFIAAEFGLSWVQSFILSVLLGVVPLWFLPPAEWHQLMDDYDNICSADTKKPATNRSLISSNPSSSFHKSVTIKSNESSPEWRTQLESLWCVFYPPKSIEFCLLPLHSRHLSAMTCWHARAVYDVLSYELHMRCSKQLYYCSRNVSVTVCKTKHCSQATENNLSFLAHLGLTNRPQ